MDTFPDILIPKNKDNFKNIYYNYVLKCLRKEMYVNILQSDETNYFDIEKFTYIYYKKNKDIMKNLTKDIISELKKLGWNCKTSFGDTAIFIYSTEKPPHNCWDDTF